MLKNIGSNWLLKLVLIGTTYFLLPFTIKQLGNDNYGIWLLINSFTGYLALLSLGVPMASVRFITHFAAQSDHKNMNQTIATCAQLYLVFGLVAFLSGVGLWFVFDKMYSFPANLQNGVKLSYFVVVWTVSISFIARLPQGVLSSFHNFVNINIVLISGVLTKFGLTIAVLTWKPSLLLLAFAQLVPLILESCALWVVVKRKFPHVQPRIGVLDSPQMRQIFSFSVYVLILNIGIQLAFQTDSLVIGKMLGVGQIPFYSVPNTVMLYAIEFVIGISAVVMPMATQLESEGKQEELRKLVFKFSKLTLTLTMLGCLLLIAFGPAFIGVWISEDFGSTSGGLLQILAISGLIFLPARGVAMPILMGIGKPKQATIAFLVTGVLNVIVSIILAGYLGLQGVALGTAIPNILFGICLIIFCAREVRFSLRSYFSQVFFKPLVAAIPLLAFFLWWNTRFQPNSYLELFLAALVSTVAFGILFVGLVFRNDADIDLLGGIMNSIKKVKK